MCMLKEIEDQRSFHDKEYKLHDILMFTILAILAGAKTYTDVATFITVHYDRLRNIFKLKWRHLPDVSSIRKIIVGGDPSEMERVFRQDAQQLEAMSEDKNKHICFDGKTLRGSFSHTKDKKGQRGFLGPLRPIVLLFWVTFLWGEKGKLPRIEKDMRFEYTYIYGAIFPERDTGKAIVIASVGKEAMLYHLNIIGQSIPKNRHAPIVMNKAPWHRSLKIPENITIVYLPSYSPKLTHVLK